MEIGEKIRNKLIESGNSVAWLAEQIGYSRTNIYKIFTKSSMDTEVLFRICCALKCDFFEEYSIKAKKAINRKPRKKKAF